MKLPEKSGRFQFIGGAIIVVAAFAIMAPGLIVFFAGLGKMFILIAVALFIAYSITVATKRRAIERQSSEEIKQVTQNSPPLAIEKPVDHKIDS